MLTNINANNRTGIVGKKFLLLGLIIGLSFVPGYIFGEMHFPGLFNIDFGFVMPEKQTCVTNYVDKVPRFLVYSLVGKRKISNYNAKYTVIATPKTRRVSYIRIVIDYITYADRAILIKKTCKKIEEKFKIKAVALTKDENEKLGLLSDNNYSFSLNNGNIIIVGSEMGTFKIIAYSSQYCDIEAREWSELYNELKGSGENI